MVSYVDVYIAWTEREQYEVTPDPCILKLDSTGLRFRNFTRSEARINLQRVPGFSSVSALVVPAGGTAVAAADLAEPRIAGEYAYQVTVSSPASLAGSSGTSAGPRVILDI